MIQIVEPDITAISQDQLRMVQVAKSFIVQDQASHAAALDFLQQVARMEKLGKALFAESKDSLNKAGKALRAAEAKLILPCTEARRIITYEKIAPFEAEERRKAEAESCRLAEIARKQEEERLLADAIEAEQQGDKQAADQILAETVTAPVVRVEPQIATAKGVTTATVWHAEVTDKLALIRYVAEHPEWVNLLDPVMPALNSLARSQKDSLAIPGVKAVSERNYRVTA